MIITRGYGRLGNILAVPLEVTLACAEFDVELTASYEIEINVLQYNIEITVDAYDLEVCGG